MWFKLKMKRTRISALKLVVALPLAYFTFVGVLTTLTGRGLMPDANLDADGIDDPSFNHKRDLLHDSDWDKRFHNPEHYPDKSRKPDIVRQNPLQPPVDRYVDRDEHIVRRIREDHLQREQELRREKDLQVAPPDDESALRHIFAPQRAHVKSTTVSKKKAVDPNSPGWFVFQLHRSHVCCSP